MSFRDVAKDNFRPTLVSPASLLFVLEQLRPAHISGGELPPAPTVETATCPRCGDAFKRLVRPSSAQKAIYCLACVKY